MKGTLMKLVSIFLLFFIFKNVHAQEISEGELIKKAMQGNFKIEQLEAVRFQSEANLNKINSKYDPKLQISSQYESTNRDAQPQEFLAEEFKSYGLQVSKKTKIGVDLSAGVSQQEIQSGGFSFYAPVSFVEAKMSLWKNLLGKSSKSELKTQKLQSRIDEIQFNLSKKEFVLNVRTLYWQLKMNQVIIGTYQELIKNSEKRFKEDNKKFKKSLITQEDVLLTQSQLLELKSSLQTYKIQQETIRQQIKLLVPSFNSQRPWKGLSYNEFIKREEVKFYRNNIISCMAEISIAEQKSSLTEISEMLDLQYKSRAAFIDSNKGADISLNTRYTGNGFGQERSQAIQDSIGFEKNTLSAQVALVIPLGSEEEKSAKKEKIALKYQLKGQKREIDLRLKTELEEKKRKIKIFQSSLGNSQESINLLSKRYKLMIKKYKQGRADLVDIKREEDQILQSKLRLIQAEFELLKEVFSLFKTYDKSNCKINKLGENI